MARVKKEYDAEGVKLTMRTRDYLADMSGQLALGIMGNLVGQMTYFYTDKVGMAVGSVGVVMAIAKILDAFTDVIFGNVVDHSRGGNKKYFRWMIALAVPAAAIVALMFMVPKNAASGAQVAYALVTNVLLSAVIYTMIATPFSAVMVVRTKSNSERASTRDQYAGRHPGRLDQVRRRAGPVRAAAVFDLLAQRPQGRLYPRSGGRERRSRASGGRACSLRPGYGNAL